MKSTTLLRRLVDHWLPRHGKLAQFVSHHLFSDGHWDVVLAVVDLERDAHELGQDGGSTGLRLDRCAVGNRLSKGHGHHVWALPGRTS